MAIRLRHLLALVLLLCIRSGVSPAAAQPGTPSPRQHWSALWISHPTAPLREPIVLRFRKAIPLAARPARYVVHVSGDRRFLFYVNGRRVGSGPASSDLRHWHY